MDRWTCGWSACGWSTRGVLVLLAALAGCDDDGGGSRPGDTGDVSADSGDVRVDGPDGGPDAPLDLPPEEVVCRPCLRQTDCGGPDNLCLNLPSGESACGLDCVGQPEGFCPEGSFCATVDEEQGLQQCVPEQLFCNDQCADQPPCPDGEICDPLRGTCALPLGPCEPCSIDAQCGENNLCLTFPDIDNTRACARDCSGGEACPLGYVCAIVGQDQTIRQCVPETLTCIDRCADVTCNDGEVCDPRSGICAPPLGICEECLTNSDCGAGDNLCLALLDGNAYCAQDCGPTSANPGVCDPGYVCFPLDATTAQCVPTILTCVDHCQEPFPVQCNAGQNCHPVDGSCHASTVDLCQRPCEENYECGGQDDFCIALEGGIGATFCAKDCADLENPCPVGYSCYPLTDNLHMQCAPSDIELECGPCSEVTCPEGEYCRPVDGACLPQPEGCTTHDECPVDQLCNVFENRCEPIGLSCRYNQFFDCGTAASCSAVTFGSEGVCLQDCGFTGSPECPDWAPECGQFSRLFGVCIERGIGGPERCGWLTSFSTELGRPCPSSEEASGCGATADTCLEEVAAGVSGFCTMDCDPEAATPCPLGGTCSRVPGEALRYCIPDDCGCLALPDLDVGEADVVQEALDGLDLTRCDLSYRGAERETAGRLVANDAFRTALAGAVRNEVLHGANAAGELLGALSHPAPVAAAIRQAALDLGGVSETIVPDFSATSFCDAVAMLFPGDAAPPSCEELADEEAAIPESIAAEVTQLIAAVGWAADQRDGIFADVDPDDLEDLLLGLHRLLQSDDEARPDMVAARELLLGIKYDALYGLGTAVARLAEVLPIEPDRTGGALDIDVMIDTPRGWIIIQGDDDHTYCEGEADCVGEANPVVVEGHVALLIDTGGGDVYLTSVGSTVGLAEPVALAIDLGGDDVYSFAEALDAEVGELPADADGRGEDSGLSLSMAGRQGSSRGGIGLLFDRGQGSDTYVALRMSQGFGLLGVGALSDDGCQDGDTCEDAFLAESLAQGAGVFGVGVLVSGDNDASYDGLTLVQGVGGPRGAGLLVDHAGDDTYLARPGTAEAIDVPVPSLLASPRLDILGNFSAAQGAGVGVPSATPASGGNLSGGIGVLVDFAGADTYTAGVMAQGAGYWHGLGMAIDAEGGDAWELHGWGQGSGMRFGAGVLVDRAGSDGYNADAGSEPWVLGSGFDFGVGLALDEGGDDVYSSHARSLGVGDFNGTGVFIDGDGNDSYTVPSPQSLGNATLSLLGADGPRESARTIGLFVDASGNDTYAGRDLDSPRIGNDESWVQRSADPTLLEWGMGADGEGGTGVEATP